MTYLSTYLNFNGYTEEVFNFYKSVFGGEFLTLMHFKDTAVADQMEEKDQNLVMHVALRVGSSLLMGTDVPAHMPQVTVGTNISIAINVESREEADRVFAALSAGGKQTMPMQDMFWGDYYGMLTDKYDIQWMVSFNEGLQSEG